MRITYPHRDNLSASDAAPDPTITSGPQGKHRRAASTPMCSNR